jgi:acyl-CoA synthetase (NDP forming)
MSSPTRSPYTARELKRLIEPKVVAVVGASETRGSFGERTLSNMADFTGDVFAVNPKYQTLLGRPCVPTLADLPVAPDCIVLCVARTMVADMIKGAGAIGAGGVVVYASGFAETAIAERLSAQRDLAVIAREAGLRIVGPNCVGLANTRLRAGMNFMPGYAEMGHKQGPLGIVSQSGALGYTVLQAMVRGVGFSRYLAAGNSCDVDVSDFISYLAEDDDTRAIICLLEGVSDGARFRAAARKARQADKALIVYKAGSGATGSKAALSHTGTMVGSAAAYRAAIEDAGAIPVDNLESMLELASFFAKTGAPAGGKTVGVLSTSGGAGVICADKAEQYGLALPPLAERTAAALRTVVPDFGSVANPADLTAEALKTPQSFSTCLDAFIADPSYSALVIPMTFAHAGSSAARAPTLTQAGARTERPLVVVWMNEWLQGPGSEVLDADAKISLFRSADRCFAALRAWFDWHGRTLEERSRLTRRSHADAQSKARMILAKAGKPGAALSESVSKQILACYGIPVPAEAVARDPEAAVAAAARLDGPLAIKIASPDIAHKSDIGGVRLGLFEPEEIRAATVEILAAASRHAPAARIEGVSVQQMAPAGVEMVLGIKNDPQFGPLIAVGLGGIMVELLRDTAVRLAPVSETTARAMVESLKGSAVLSAFRGRAGVDIGGLVGAICRLSELADDLNDVVDQIDVNPLIVSASGVMAADALIVLRA